MNLEDIYECLDVKGIAEKSFQKKLIRLNEMQEGKFKERLIKNSSKSKTLEVIQNEVNEFLARNTNTPSEILKQLMENESFKAKELLASNPNTPVDILYQLYDMGCIHSLVKNPNAPTELLQQIYDATINNPEEVRGQYNPNTQIFYDIAKNPNAPQEVLRALSVSEDKISGSETIQKAVAQNPSTPVDILEGFARLNDSRGIYISSRYEILGNPNIPVDLMNKVIDMRSSEYYRYRGTDNLLVGNPNLSPDILQNIAENIRYSDDPTHILSDLLEHPNTPLSIIEDYSSKIDYDSVLPGDLYSVLYSIVKNPNTPSQILGKIKTEIDKRKSENEYTNCTYVIPDILENPNTPQEILEEYIQKAITEGTITYELKSILENPAVFDALKDKKRAKTPLQQREAELSELEKEEKIIAEAETLIDMQNSKEGQNIGE